LLTDFFDFPDFDRLLLGATSDFSGLCPPPSVDISMLGVLSASNGVISVGFVLGHPQLYKLY
jgi:hypothetical protein